MVIFHNTLLNSFHQHFRFANAEKLTKNARATSWIRGIVWLIVMNTDSSVGVCGDGEPVALTAPTGTIKSPGYDRGQYPNNAVCRWLIVAPSNGVRIR